MGPPGLPGHCDCPKPDIGPRGEQGPPGPPGVGLSRVYDANGQYLGFFIGNWYEGEVVEIRVPALNAGIIISKLTGEVASGREVLFTNTSCDFSAGEAYSQKNIDVISRYCRSGGDCGYALASGAPRQVNALRGLARDNSACYEVLAGSYPGVRVTWIPAEEIPFTLPVALPLRIEAE